jgi:hypothetical protein
MSRSEGVVWCDGCGVEISWAPLVKSDSDMRRGDYCCEDCYAGIPCRCGERMELEDERREGSDTE